MKGLSRIARRSLRFATVLACLLAATSIAASAQTSVNRVSYQGETHTGLCCSAWDASVTVKEAEKLVPIVITFSTDYHATAPFFAAIRLNDGPCTFYGPTYLPAFNPDDLTYTSKTFQWIILPGDYKLTRGRNVIQLCGGGTSSTDDSITLGFYTLSAHLQR